MKYALLFTSGGAMAATAEADRKKMYEAVGKWWGEHSQAGRIVSGEELQPASTATTVRFAPGKSPVVTDGPFIEAKETIGGFALIDVPDLDAALAMAKTWPASSAVEIRPLVVEQR